jgi:hypothetical protein
MSATTTVKVGSHITEIDWQEGHRRNRLIS